MNGRVWFVGPPAVSGHYFVYDQVDDDQLFTLVTDSLGLGSAPAVVFDPRVDVPETRFYPKGLDQPDEYDSISLADDDLTLEDIYPVIERVYAVCLVTPDAQPRAGKLWADPKKWWASSQAEAIVQMEIQAGLVGAFPTCTIRPEQSVPEGRDDLEIERGDPQDPSQITRIALVELKVLRSFSERGKAIPVATEHGRIEDGVKQASAYQISKSFKSSTLCCFDMRNTDTGEDCFDHVRGLATGLSVDLKRWSIYSSSKHYRDALASGRSKA